MPVGFSLIAGEAFGGEKKIERYVRRLDSLDDPRFMKVPGVPLGPAFVNGQQFETYVYRSGHIGREFAHALTDRALLGHVCFGSRAYVRYRTYFASVDAYRGIGAVLICPRTA